MSITSTHLNPKQSTLGIKQICIWEDILHFNRLLSAIVSSTILFATHGALASDKRVKIGVLTDLSSIYADGTGAGSVLAAKMAVEDSGLSSKGWDIQVVAGDHQNKADVGVGIARRWFDLDKVDVIVDGPTSSVALATNNLVKEKNRVFLNSGAGSSDLTNSACSPNMVHWTYDTYMLANGTGAALTKSGGDTWFFLTADYAFGAALERDASAAVKSMNGTVVGGVRHPINTPDFSSFLLQAQASGAKVIGLGNAGGDTINAIKQAAEFGVGREKQKLAAMLMFITDVHSLGLKNAGGLFLTETFYWDLNDNTRAFSRRFRERLGADRMPTMLQAGVYASLLHYFKALEAIGDNLQDGVKIVETMKSMPTDDALFGKGSIQPNGRKIHPAYLFKVKSPEASKGAWDYYELVSTIPADLAFTPLDKSSCLLLSRR